MVESESSIKTAFLKGENNFQTTNSFPTVEQLCIVLQLMWEFFNLISVLCKLKVSSSQQGGSGGKGACGQG